MTQRTAAKLLEQLRQFDIQHPDSEVTLFFKTLKEMPVEDQIELCFRSAEVHSRRHEEMFKWISVAIETHSGHLEDISKFLKPQNYTDKSETKQ